MKSSSETKLPPDQIDTTGFTITNPEMLPCGKPQERLERSLHGSQMESHQIAVKLEGHMRNSELGC